MSYDNGLNDFRTFILNIKSRNIQTTLQSITLEVTVRIQSVINNGNKLHDFVFFYKWWPVSSLRRGISPCQEKGTQKTAFKGQIRGNSLIYREILHGKPSVYSSCYIDKICWWRLYELYLRIIIYFKDIV